jgi:hypothetical protein
VALASTACGQNHAAAPSSSDPTSGDLAGCEPGQPLAGATYDVTKSRFAFGGQPVRQTDTGIVRWVGPDGVVAIFSNGYAGGSLNGGAPEAGLPGWSQDPTALAAHVRAYFAAMGVAGCQVQTQITGGSGGRDASIVRTVGGVIVSESLAYAEFDSADQTTAEGFYWPEIPAGVAADARAFHDRLADPSMLAAYKAQLPAEAQGDGAVVVHHTDGAASTQPFTAAAVYDVFEMNPLGRGGNHYFDAAGHEVTATWQ